MFAAILFSPHPSSATSPLIAVLAHRVEIDITTAHKRGIELKVTDANIRLLILETPPRLSCPAAGFSFDRPWWRKAAVVGLCQQAFK
jgi:hypothetical protein